MLVYKDDDKSLFFIWIILALILIFFLIKRKDELLRIDNEIYLKNISELLIKEAKENSEVATRMTRKNRRRKVIIEITDNLPNPFKSNLQDLHIKVCDV